MAAGPPTYPTVQVKMSMPPGAPSVLVHRGQTAQLPGKFDHGAATYLLSRFDCLAAQRLCADEHFDPIRLRVPDAPPCAVGFVATIEYHQTDVGPYREWILGIWVAPRRGPAPRPEWVNATSLAFYAFPTGEPFAFFAPKMILTEALPTEVGLEHYGIPKEIGHVRYERGRQQTHCEVGSATGPWIMRASVPSTRRFLARLHLVPSLVRAFGLGRLLRFAWRDELPLILAGSAKIQAKQALAVAKVDRQAEFLLWSDCDCHLSINREAEWGKVLYDLGFAPELICHMPNVAFVLSGPFDQVIGDAAPELSGSRAEGRP
jgi:hypothetical protein